MPALQLTCNQGHTFDPPFSEGEVGVEFIIGENVRTVCPTCEAEVLIPEGVYVTLHGGRVRPVE